MVKKVECNGCIHKKICDLWVEEESQNASCYVENCKETLQDIIGYDVGRLSELVEESKRLKCEIREKAACFPLDRMRSLEEKLEKVTTEASECQGLLHSYQDACDGVDLQSIKKIVEAYRERRLFEAPFSIGDPVWITMVYGEKVERPIEAFVESIRFCFTFQPTFWTAIITNGELQEGEREFEITRDSLGIAVFLNYEDAEAAISGMATTRAANEEK